VLWLAWLDYHHVRAQEQQRQVERPCLFKEKELVSQVHRLVLLKEERFLQDHLLIELMQPLPFPATCPLGPRILVDATMIVTMEWVLPTRLITTEVKWEEAIEKVPSVEAQ